MRGTRGRRASATAAVLVAVGLSLSGCGGDGDATFVTDDGTVTVDQDGEGGSITIDSSAGSMTITGESGGELPEGWPAQVVLPGGGTIDSSGSFSGDEGGAWQVAVTYPDKTAKDVADELRTSLESQGFEVQAEFKTGDATAVTLTGDGYNVTATASDEESGATAVVVVALES